MRFLMLAVAVLCQSTLHAQALPPAGQLPGKGVQIDLTPKIDLATVAVVDRDGKQVVPQEVTHYDVNWMAVPLVGYKTKIRYEMPKEVPVVQPARLLLGKAAPDDMNAVRLAKLIDDDGKLTVKARIGFSLSIDDECAPFGGSMDKIKPVRGNDGVWELALDKPLAPGLYALIAATGSPSMWGGPTVKSSARIFRVSDAPPAAPAQAAADGTQIAK